MHATGQVAHIDLERAWEPKVVREAINAHLWPEPVAVLDAAEVGEDFHARFSARGRRYLYRILNRRAPPALDQGRVWHVKKPLDAEAMHAAAQALVGQHDFTTFRDAQCQAKIAGQDPRRGPGLARGRGGAARLRRALVPPPAGPLDDRLAGRGRRRPLAARTQLKAALEARDRKACGPVAPPEGLYLTGVDY